MLAAGTPAIAGAGEEAIMATGRCMRMIVAILGGGVGPAVIMTVILFHRRVIIRPGMIGGLLILVVLRAILSAHSQRNQRDCYQCEDERLPILLWHARTSGE